MRIAIQGEPGSFSHEAAMKLVAGATIVPCSLSADAFSALVNGSVDAAVIPIENSLAGSVSEHFDLLLAHDVTVERETLLRIRHNLIAISGTSVGEIDRVFSHPVALAQCRRFLANHPRMESFAFYDTAGSVKQLVELRDRHAAAIASEAAAHYYGAQILQAGIEDNPENYTRFFLVRRTRDAVLDPQSNWWPRSTIFPLSAPTSPKSSPAPCTENPGNIFSTWIARSTPPMKARKPSTRSSAVAPWSRNSAATSKPPTISPPLLST